MLTDNFHIGYSRQVQLDMLLMRLGAKLINDFHDIIIDIHTS